MKKIKGANCLAMALVGVEGFQVMVESHITDGLPKVTIVGLPDASLNEARSRVFSAFQATGFPTPYGHITVNLAPASLPKQGPSFDLAIAMATVAAVNPEVREKIRGTVFIGELGLDGRIRPVRGVLPMVVSALKLGARKIVFPLDDKAEAELAVSSNLTAGEGKGQAEVIGAGHLFEVLNRFGGKVDELEYEPARKAESARKVHVKKKSADMADVLGQQEAKKALEIAAAGGHNVLMVGPPGTGKTMLASRITSILPDLDSKLALEVTSLHSIAGTLEDPHLMIRPPFEAPHHTATSPAIIGGGSGVPKPGAISRAHGGVLFLDEAPEFSPRVLQTLRQPLESGEVIIDRALGQARYPARFQLILAANPCPCGMYSSDITSSGQKCTCSSLVRRRYFAKLSGPLLDRIDLSVEVNNVNKAEYLNEQNESSATIKARVEVARKLAEERYKDTPWKMNSEIPGSYLRTLIQEQPDIVNTLGNAVDRGSLSLRGADRALRVAFTLADLQGKPMPELEDIGLALSMRSTSLVDEQFG